MKKVLDKICLLQPDKLKNYVKIKFKMTVSGILFNQIFIFNKILNSENM